MTEARDYHCSSHVFENLGERSIPSDHVAVRVVLQKQTVRCDEVKRIPSWMSEHPVSCSLLKKISDGHQYPDDPSAALADFKVILEKARKLTHHELLRNTPDCLGTKLLIASTAWRAYRNRHLGHADALLWSLGTCREMLRPLLLRVYWLSSVSQISFASLTRERIAEREAEIHILPWTQTEQRQRLGHMQT